MNLSELIETEFEPVACRHLFDLPRTEFNKDNPVVKRIGRPFRFLISQSCFEKGIPIWLMNNSRERIAELLEYYEAEGLPEYCAILKKKLSELAA